MMRLVVSDLYKGYLAHALVCAQTDETSESFHWINEDFDLFNSIEEVREQMLRKYGDALREPLMLDTDEKPEPQVGWVFGYEGNLVDNAEVDRIRFEDWVLVHRLCGEAIAPEEWMEAEVPSSTPEGIKESHLEEELSDALQLLLDCSELNMDDMEPETREAIEHARQVLAAREPKQ